MTDTFSFHPPPVSPSYSYPVLSEPSVFSHQRPNSTSGYGGPQHEQEVSSGPYSYGSAGPVDGRREEGLGEAIGGGGRRRPEEEGSFVPGQRSRGGSPGAPSSLPYASHFQAGPFSYSNRGMLGANIRNTRPMTAPSSVSAPYFQGAIYSPTPHASSSYYPPQLAQAFSYQVDSSAALEADAYRARGFSLPELAGLVPGGGDAGGPLDEQRYSSRPGSAGGRRGSATFMYGLPPPAEGSVQDGSSPEQHSRPTTGDSRPNSSHDTVGRFGQRQPGRAPPGSRDNRAAGEMGPYATMDGAPSHFNESKLYNFAGNVSQPAKRPRRRYDEIERLYTCDYPGCQKAYGTLNHLNSHKTMQKHGPKSTPAQFKELRKAWRESKKAAANAAARARPPASPSSKSQHETAEYESRSSNDRPRPSTSAGEYHYSVPTPFMSSLGSGIPPYPPAQMQLPSAQFTFGALPPDPLMAGWHSPYSQSAAFDHPQLGNPGTPYLTSPHRPVTAPSYYSNAPTFGHYVDRNISAGFEMSGRRLSLPQADMRLPSVPTTFGFPGLPQDHFASIQEEGGAYGAANGARGASEEEDEREGRP